MQVDLSPALAQLEAIVTGLIRRLPDLVIGMLIFALFYGAAKGMSTPVTRVGHRSRLSPHLVLILGHLSTWLLTTFGLFVALTIILPEFGAGELIQLLGIGSLAIGFAFRDIFENFLAGILLLLTEPFHIGDQIVVNEFEGTVEDIHTRATLIRPYDGCRIVLPNADLFTQSVTVNTAFTHRRSEFDVRIGYGDDLVQAKQLILGQSGASRG